MSSDCVKLLKLNLHIIIIKRTIGKNKMDIQQCFEILELNPGISMEEAKLTYRDLIKVWHPDRFAGDSRLQTKADKKLKQINLAYETIVSYLSGKQESYPSSSPFGEHGDSFSESNRDSASCEKTANRIWKSKRSSDKTSLENKRVITVASGKGGVGKTNFSVNISLALKKLNKKVMILDADVGMANIDVVCGLTPKYNMGDVIYGSKRLDEVILDNFEGIKIVPGVSGVTNLADLNPSQQQFFFEELSRYEDTDDSEIVIIDIGAGMSASVMNFMLAGNENIIIVTPEPTSIMDAYALIKTLLNKNPNADLNMVVNMVRNPKEAMEVYNAMKRIIIKFLGSNIHYLGHIVTDKVVSKAVRRQQPFFLAYPDSQAGTCIYQIAHSLIKKPYPDIRTDSIKGFFKRMSSFVRG